MPYSYDERAAASPADKTYAYTFPAISTDHIKVRANGVELTAGDATNGFTIVGSDAVLGSAVVVDTGHIVRVYRETPRDSALVMFQDGAGLRAAALTMAFNQGWYSALEALDQMAQPALRAGAGTPDDATGADGDFWLDTDTNDLYGPKAAGAWPATPRASL